MRKVTSVVRARSKVVRTLHLIRRLPSANSKNTSRIKDGYKLVDVCPFLCVYEKQRVFAAKKESRRPSATIKLDPKAISYRES